MRVALIGDVHANLPALEAVLQHARRHRVDEVWGVGDWVGDGAFPDEVVQLLQQRGVQAIAGNYDLSVLKVQQKRAKWGEDGPPQNWQPAAWAYDHLSEESREYLRSLPPEMRLEVQGRRIVLAHIAPALPNRRRDGVPALQEELLTADTPLSRLRELARVAAPPRARGERATAGIVVVGHAHVPLARKVGSVWFINTGSVGRPRDADPRACYAILTLGEKRVQVRHYRVEYEAREPSAPVEAIGAPAMPQQEDAVAAPPTPPRTRGAVASTSALETVAEARGTVASNSTLEAVAATLPVTAAPAGELPVPETGVDSRLQAVLQLAQSCEYEEEHTQQVTRLALRLFDELKLVHGLGPKERYWLQCGALLHDIGLIEGVKGHHKASLRIIRDSPILTFDKKERLIIGSIARYHRAALPQQRHRHFVALKPGLRRIVRILAAILRVADGLDYTHQSVVHDLCCVLSPKRILVRCAVTGPAEDERQRALQKGDLLEQVLNRKLLVECQES